MKWFSECAPLAAFLFALAVAAYAYGYLSHRFDLFPSRFIRKAELGLRDVRETVVERPWYRTEVPQRERATLFRPERLQPGLTLVAGIDGTNRQFAAVVDRDAREVHRWNLDWFELWPDATHLREEARPKSAPGAIVHGMLLTDDGGLIFNYEALGLVRVDACGRVVWRLPLETHHSLHRDDDGNLWTSVRREHHAPLPSLPNYQSPFYEYTLVQVSPCGEVLQEISLIDLFREADLPGMLYMATLYDETTQTTGDALHLNDVEVFTSDLTPGFFQPGDVMISLRRPNAVIVFDLAARRAKHVSVAGWVRQHDPDFIDGHTISVYDNHYLGDRESGAQSRIVIESVPAGVRRVAFRGTPERPFFSRILGKHEWLPNGNLLALESTEGRVLELTPDGEPVWEYVNLIGDGLASVLSEGSRLVETYDERYFAERREECAEREAPPPRTWPRPPPPPSRPALE